MTALIEGCSASHECHTPWFASRLSAQASAVLVPEPVHGSGLPARAAGGAAGVSVNMGHGTVRMRMHSYLDFALPLVQETPFASGLGVVANFGDEPFTTGEGRTVAARSALMEE